MAEERRRKRPKRLSIFTDLLILIFLSLIFYVIMHIVKNDKNNPFEEDTLYLEQLESYDKNQILIEKIHKEFGVTVLSGEQTRSDAEKVNASIQTDDDEIFKNLEVMYEVFKNYPKEYFNKAKLTVVILDSFYNNNIALASRNSLEQYKIYISNAEEYYRSLNHEMYHVFEYILRANGNESKISDWDDLNPDGFEYISNVYEINGEYVYKDSLEDLNNVYFVTKYSKASNKEDRAEVFAEIMTFNEKSQKYFLKENPIKAKAEFIINILNETYSSIIKYKWHIF